MCRFLKGRLSLKTSLSFEICWSRLFSSTTACQTNDIVTVFDKSQQDIKCFIRHRYSITVRQQRPVCNVYYKATKLIKAIFRLSHIQKFSENSVNQTRKFRSQNSKINNVGRMKSHSNCHLTQKNSNLDTSNVQRCIYRLAIRRMIRSLRPQLYIEADE